MAMMACWSGRKAGFTTVLGSSKIPLVRLRGVMWIPGLLLWLSWSIAAAQPALPISAEASQSLSVYSRLFDDPTGRLDLAAVQRADAERQFRPLPSFSPSLGYLQGATWVRFAVSNPSPASQERWLHVNWVFQQSYSLYLSDGQGHVEKQESGTQVPIAQRPLASRQVLFPIRLAPGETKTAYLRIAGRAITVVNLSLWQPAAFLDHVALSNAVKYMGLGATVIMLVFGFLDFRVRRVPGLLAAIPAYLLTVLIGFWMDGFPVDWLPANPNFWLTRGMHALSFTAFFCHVIFARAFLCLSEHLPRCNRFMFGVAVGCLLLAAFQFFGIFPAFNLCAFLVVTSLLTWVSLRAAHYRGAAGFAYLTVWGGFWLIVFIQTIQALGWLDSPYFSDLWLLGLVVSCLAMTYALYQDVESVRLDSMAVQARLLAREYGEAQRLASAVEEGTAELREAVAQAEAASQAKSAFLSMVSHEFRTPLHTILGYAGLLKKQVGEDLSDKLSIIEKSGTQLLHLIEQALYFSRDGESMALNAEPVNLRELASYLEKTGQMLAGKAGNQFVVELSPNLPATVVVDEPRLNQVLLNLISNACKYTKHGRIFLRFIAEPFSASKLSEMPPQYRHPIGAKPESQPNTRGPAGPVFHKIRFEVEDNGIGIAETDKAFVFEPFSRGTNGQRQAGLGLGLAIARKIVLAMGGDIGFQSKLGRGSRFHFTLYLGEASPEVPAEGAVADGEATQPVGSRLTLLIADGVAAHREHLGGLCRTLGFDVVFAADGEIAANFRRKTDPPIAVALVEQFMPRMDGWAFLKTIRMTPRLVELPVILVSSTPSQRPAGFPAGMDFNGLLKKPVTLERLVEALQSVLYLQWLHEAPSACPAKKGDFHIESAADDITCAFCRDAGIPPQSCESIRQHQRSIRQSYQRYLALQGFGFPQSGAAALGQAKEGRAVDARHAALPSEKLLEFKAMLDLGQVLALRRWADSLSESHPDCAELAAQIKRLCQTIDLEGLQRLWGQISGETKTTVAEPKH